MIFVWLEVSISWVWRLGSLLLTFSPVHIAACSDSPTATLHPARHCPTVHRPPQLSNSLSARTATRNLCPLLLLLSLPAIPHAAGAPCSCHELSHDAMLPPRLTCLSVPPDVAIARRAPCHCLLAPRSCRCLQLGCADACCWCPMHRMRAQTMHEAK